MEARQSADSDPSSEQLSRSPPNDRGLFTKKGRTISFFQRHESVDLTSFPSLAVSDMESVAIKAGFLFKRGGGKRSSAWKRRYFLLTGQHLLYYKSEKEKRPQGVITPLRSFEFINEVDDGKNKQYQFRLAPRLKEGRSYAIYAISKEEKEEWIEILERLCSGANYTKAALQIEVQLKKNSYDIPAKDLEWNSTSELLGKGASGMVKKGLWLKTTEVAIKALNNLPELTDENEMTLFMNEIATLSTLRHPNIVPMFGYCRKDGYICLVTEFVKGGDLFSAIHNQEIQLPLQLKAYLMSSIARGMVYLHSKDIIHRDLKPHNILVENLEEAKVKVCDFGLSTITRNEQGQQEKIFGSVAYAAPELPTPLHTKKVDVFSFAVIMWEIFTRERPWTSKNHTMQIVEGVANGERLTIPAPCPFADLISRCWDGDPDKRPSFNSIYEELEPIKGEIALTQDYGNASLASRQMPMDDPPEERIGKVFRDQTSVTWFEFQEALHEVFALSVESTERLKVVVADGEIVQKERWIQFTKWFSPMVKVDYYQTSNSGTENMQGYQIEDVVDIVGQTWFYGFITANESKDILQNLPPGSFLFRFSSNPGCYALSVNYGQIGHWRITTEKFGVSYPVFKIDGRTYRSMHEIIEVHGMGNDPLEIKSSSSIKSCFLKIPADRTRSNLRDNNPKRIYEAFD